MGLRDVAPPAYAGDAVDVDPLDHLVRRQSVETHGHDIDLVPLSDQFPAKLVRHRSGATANRRELVV